MIEKRWLRSIHTSEGKLVTARPHEATFNGRHNCCKSKTLVVLYHRKQKISETTGLTLRELSLASGVSYAYLKSRLAKWVEWKYLVRKMTDGINRPVYSYLIGERGEHFVEDRIPRERLVEYVAEIRINNLGRK